MAAKKVSTPKAAPNENTLLKVKITSGDSIVRLPKRMLLVEDEHVIVTREEYEQLQKMKVCQHGM